MTVAAAVERSCAASRARERARTRRRARRRRPSARRCSGRSHQADFYRVCCVFLVGSFVFIAHSPHAIERPPLLVTFDRTSRCLGRSSLVLVACREMIRHHLRGRAEEAWCFVSNACFSSVLSYLSRTPLMLLGAPPLLVTSDRTSRVSGVICAVDWCGDFWCSLKRRTWLVFAVAASRKRGTTRGKLLFDFRFQ